MSKNPSRSDALVRVSRPLLETTTTKLAVLPNQRRKRWLSLLTHKSILSDLFSFYLMA